MTDETLRILGYEVGTFEEWTGDDNDFDLIQYSGVKPNDEFKKGFPEGFDSLEINWADGTLAFYTNEGMQGPDVKLVEWIIRISEGL
jgi:hypothetical protein